MYHDWYSNILSNSAPFLMSNFSVIFFLKKVQKYIVTNVWH